jgi:hypothetical protein
MNNLTHELLKNSTTLVQLTHLNSLCTKLVDKTTDVYGLRAEFGYPEHLIPSNNKRFLAYIGISKIKLETSYGESHFITFFHEPKLQFYRTPVGVLEHMYNIYMEQKNDELIEDGFREGENLSVELFPGKIEYKDIGYWKGVFQDDWNVCDKISMDDLIDDYELKKYIDWTLLYNILPENIDDVKESEKTLDDELEYDDEDIIDSDDEETDDEIEEGEILSDSET